MVGKKARTSITAAPQERDKCNSSSDNGALIPQELIDQILLELPEKSLARFKSVSKYWRSHISSHNFKKDYSKPFGLGIYPIFRRFSRNHRKFESSAFRGPEKCMTVKPLMKTDYHQRLVGSANGVVCYVIDTDVWRLLELTLWNPSTGDSLTVKMESEYPFVENELHCYAFGYDSDYKAARLFFNDNRWGGAVYSLSTKAWQIVDVDQALLAHRMAEIKWSSQTLCGTAHWVACCDGDVRAIVWLRMTDPIDVGQMALPPSLESSRCRLDFPSFRDFKGMLTLFEYENERTPLCKCWIWVMEHYGNSYSWTKLDVTLELGRPFKAIGFLSDSTLLLGVKGKFISYNIHTQCEEVLGEADSFVGAYMENSAPLL